ncbi:MAG: hypothetical protein ACI8RZ_005230 [Myxococcota bacterium]
MGSGIEVYDYDNASQNIGAGLIRAVAAIYFRDGVTTSLPGSHHQSLMPGSNMKYILTTLLLSATCQFSAHAAPSYCSNVTYKNAGACTP